MVLLQADRPLLVHAPHVRARLGGERIRDGPRRRREEIRPQRSAGGLFVGPEQERRLRGQGDESEAGLEVSSMGFRRERLLLESGKLIRWKMKKIHGPLDLTVVKSF